MISKEKQALAHNNTVLSQILKLVCRHEFESLAKTHHRGQKLRKMSRWSQFVALCMAQLSGRSSLRDIESNLCAQQSKLYHLGVTKVTRSSLARVNEQQPCGLYESLFGRLLNRCQAMAPGHGFRFHNKLYSLDASTIDLCLSVFPWAKFRTTKGAIKLHAAINHDGYLPSFVALTEGNVHEVKMAKYVQLPKGSIVVFDRGYIDYAWYNSLNSRNISFVTRQKCNADYQVLERREVNASSGVTSDQVIKLTGTKASQCPIKLRRVGYRDPDTGKHYVFVTNNFKLAAKTIADIYKSRWQIEMFFKWIKQNLKIKTFIGTSKNAVMTQIWIALCVYLILSYLKFTSCMNRSIQQILKLLQLNLFDRRDLILLIQGRNLDPPGFINQNQMSLL
jgi:putative transposase